MCLQMLNTFQCVLLSFYEMNNRSHQLYLQCPAQPIDHQECIYPTESERLIEGGRLTKAGLPRRLAGLSCLPKLTVLFGRHATVALAESAPMWPEWHNNLGWKRLKPGGTPQWRRQLHRDVTCCGDNGAASFRRRATPRRLIYRGSAAGPLRRPPTTQGRRQAN